MKDFRINIAGLGEKVHDFRYQLNRSFFEHFGKELTDEGSLSVHLLLDKHSTFLSAEIHMTGTVRLVCDRSLDPFDHQLDIRSRILFKYAEQAGELTEDIIHITRETVTLDFGPVFYDLIGSSLPIKRLHPRYAEQEENEPEEGGIVYRSENPDDDTIDPRWEQLKKLKN